LIGYWQAGRLTYVLKLRLSVIRCRTFLENDAKYNSEKCLLRSLTSGWGRQISPGAGSTTVGALSKEQTERVDWRFAQRALENGCVLRHAARPMPRCPRSR